MLKVMVVEDDSETRDGICYALSQIGYQVISASNAKDAMIMYCGELPDVVLTDYHMDRWGSGLDLLTMLKKKYEKVLVIVMTSNATVEIAVEAMKQGSCDFLCKPFDLTKLEDVLARIALQIERRKLVVKLQDSEKEQIEKALNSTNSLCEAAAKLGIDKSTLWRKRKHYGLFEKKTA